MKCNISNRTIFNNDNVNILQGINSDSIDLIYLDPPFNKKKEFTAPIGSSSEGASFKDWFREEDVKDDWVQTIKEDTIGLYNFLNGVKNLSSITSGKNNKYYLYNYCYLSYMAIRLIEMQRILKDTGSIYLHCDPTMSHYLKILMDIIFGENNFRNEIVWCYSTATTPYIRQFPRNTDIIYWYSKDNNWIFNKKDISVEYKGGSPHGGNKWIKKEETLEGWRYRQSKKGKIPFSWWNDIFKVGTSKERTGYPTQKPLALLERIIKTSSNEGDIVLDPFCGCATTCVASEKLNRKWIGIDVSVKAYELVKERLKKKVANPEILFDYEKEIIFKTNAPKRTDTNGDDTRLKKYVYIISNEKYFNEYKIGIAKNYKSRLEAYQTADPNRSYQLEYKIHTHLFRETEKHIHHTFDNKHEWVQADKNNIIQAIEKFLKENE